MNNLNRRGYLTVEVILASVVAVSIAIFLMNITIKLVDVTDDVYVNTELLTDKALIIKNIKSGIEEDIKNGGGISSIELTSGRQSMINISFCNSAYNRGVYISSNKLIYKNTNDNTELYSKDLSKYLSGYSVSSTTGTINNNEYVLFKVTGVNKFSEDNFEADIIVLNKKTC